MTRLTVQRSWRWLSAQRPPSIPGGLGPWVGLLSVGFVLSALVRHSQGLMALSLDRQGIGWALLGLGTAWLSLVINALAWGTGLRWLGIAPDSGRLVALFLATNLRKYLPGGAWHLLARIQALRQDRLGLGHAVPTSTAVLAAVLDPLLMALAALALVPLGGWQGGLLLLGLAPALLLGLPDRLRGVLGWLERQKARHLSLELAPLPTLEGRPWGAWLMELGFVLVRFLAFAFCVQAFDLAQPLGWPAWLAAFALAWTAGLVVPGAPGGLGVFEAVLLLRLSGVVADAPLLAVALSYRLVTTVADLLAAMVVRLEPSSSSTDRATDSQ